ncbi:MAG: NAD(P)H-quinone dehydrogenase [Actinomycetales bacterium]
MTDTFTDSQTRVVIVGGGPGGYEAALVASQLGAQVTLIERAGVGGSAVLTDVVPSKTLIATAEVLTLVDDAHEKGVVFPGVAGDPVLGEALGVDLGRINSRVMGLAEAQSLDIRTRLADAGVTLLTGTGRLDGPERVIVEDEQGLRHDIDADVVLVSVGAHPRTLAEAAPDGERILTWTQLYTLTTLPQRLIVVGSGVTGAEFASAYNALGADMVLVSSRDRVLPGEDADASAVIEQAFERRGMTVMSKSRAAAAVNTGDGVLVTLDDGRTVEGSHCLMAVGSIPNTADLGLTEAGVKLTDSGHVLVDKVSRTSRRGVYAAGDCTGVLPLASVAAMQGRIAMWHALGDAVSPLDLNMVSANVFTAPEIATVGVSEQDIRSERVAGQVHRLALAGNPRAKMAGISEGFVKLMASPNGTVIGGVVVAPAASELIFPVTVAVQNRLTVDAVATTFTVYPSLSGSIAEAARALHRTR